MTLTWRKIDNNTAIDAQFIPPYSKDNKYLRVVLRGIVTDSYIPVDLFYGAALIGTGTVNRTNLY
jgi:hypothetical protein